MDWGWKGDRWVEEITAVILRCLVAPADRQVKCYAGREVDGDAAAARDRTVLYRMLLDTVGTVVQAAPPSGLWLGSYGGVKSLDFWRAPILYR